MIFIFVKTMIWFCTHRWPQNNPEFNDGIFYVASTKTHTPHKVDDNDYWPKRRR